MVAEFLHHSVHKVELDKGLNIEYGLAADTGGGETKRYRQRLAGAELEEVRLVKITRVAAVLGGKPPRLFQTVGPSPIQGRSYPAGPLGKGVQAHAARASRESRLDHGLDAPIHRIRSEETTWQDLNLDDYRMIRDWRVAGKGSFAPSKAP